MADSLMAGALADRYRLERELGRGVGQVYLAHGTCGSQWKYLSILPGASDAYNAQPTLEKPSAHAKSVGGSAGLPREKS